MRKLLYLTKENVARLDAKLSEKIGKIFKNLPENDEENVDNWCLFEDNAKNYYFSYNFFFVWFLDLGRFCSGEVFFPIEENCSVAYVRFEPFAMEINNLFLLDSVEATREEISQISHSIPVDEQMYLPVAFSGDYDGGRVFCNEGRVLICNAAMSTERGGVGDFNVSFRDDEPGPYKVHFSAGGLCGLKGQF